MSIKFLKRPGKPDIAYRKLEAETNGKGLPTVMFCGGFRSDMEGTKATFLEEECRKRGQACIRFDYSGHGGSSGRFEDGCIGEWAKDALAVMDELTEGPVLLVGSSMGGWISLLLALERPARVCAMVGIAAAPDFTRTIWNKDMDEAQRSVMQAQGHIDVPSEYSDVPYRITYRLIEDGEQHCLLDEEIVLDIPVCLLQGMQDSDVPWQTAYRIKNAMRDPDLCEVVLIESGDHRLSRPEDLALLWEKVETLSGNV